MGEAVDAKTVKLREALRDELIRELIVTVDADHKFFGVVSICGVAVTASVRCQLPWLGDGPRAVFEARGRATVRVDIPGGSAQTTIQLVVRVEKDIPRIAWEFESPEWPSLHLPVLPFDFSSLKWPVDLTFDSRLPTFDLPPLPAFDHLEFVWQGGTPPSLKLEVAANGDLTATAGPATGILSKKGGPEVLRITDFKVQSAPGSPLTIAGVLSLTDPYLTLIQTKTIDDENLPIVVRLTDVAVELPATVPLVYPIVVTLTIARLEVQSKTDPSLILAFRATLVLKVEPDGTYSTAFKDLWLLAPTPFQLISALANYVAGISIRASFALDLPGPNTDPALVALLDRTVRILQASLRWMVERAGSAASAVAGLAESVLDLLGQLIRELSDAAQSVYRELVVEIRLDPRTYRLRQVILTPRAFLAARPDTFKGDFAGIAIEAESQFKPALVLDFTESNWFGIALLNDKAKPKVTVGTDLWLARETTPAQPMKGLNADTGSGADQEGRLITLTAEAQGDVAFVPIAFASGRLTLFQATEYISPTLHGGDWFTLAETAQLRNIADTDVKIEFTADGLKNRLLDLLPKPKASTATGSSFFDSLDNYVRVSAVSAAEADLEERTIEVSLKVQIVLKETFKPEATLDLTVKLDDLKAEITGGDRISVRSNDAGIEEELLGMDLKIVEGPKGDAPPGFECFYLDLSDGRQEFGLSKQASATLGFSALSSSGGGLKFQVSKFSLSRGGLNLSAQTIDEPVTLGGLNMPFRFKQGSLDIVDSRFAGASLSGAGQLPPALIGEANVSISVRLRESNNRIIVESAEANLDKGEDPIVCNATRFRFTIRKLGMSFETEQQGAAERYHFYFLLTGSARFQPAAGEFGSGLLKNLKDLEIVLDRTPLTGDGRLLMQRINFQAKVDPPRKSRFFDLFEFELRGIGLHPSAPEFGGLPAMSISGQVKFTETFDKVQPSFRFHELWIAPPRPNEILPQIRFDGLTLGLDLKGMGSVEGTAVAVDGTLPKSLYKPDILPANVTANGFLAAGKLKIEGWASMSAAMGFLELKDKTGIKATNLAYFLYIQQNELSEAIPTPVGTLYLREVGFGFGWRYTLKGIAAVENATSPQQLVQILDEVSKVQGDLDSIEAWTPTPESATLTLAMRALFSVTSASSSNSYNSDKEKELPNPLLFDLVAAIRSDLTFLMNVRVWIAVNYADWHELNFSGRDRPTLRGFLYLSVPKQTFLARLVSNRNGLVGDHPPLPPVLKQSLEAVSYSSTLFIRPGLFHFEMGWPYELGVDLGDPGGNFFLSCKGGMVFRIEDGAALYGYALRATGFAQIGGSTGGSFGAAAVARADFALEGKLLSYVSLRSPGDSMFYASFRVDLHVSVSVRVWLEVSVFGHDVHLETGFTFGVTVAVAIELAILLNNGLGARIYAAVGVQGFGRSLTLGMELKFGDSVLDAARARVERFLSLGLGASIPETESLGQPPALEGSRRQRAQLADGPGTSGAGSTPRPTSPSFAAATVIPAGILAADFWAMLFPINGSAEQYVLQLVPRDLTGLLEDPNSSERKPGSFFGPCGAPDSVSYAHRLALGTQSLVAIRPGAGKADRLVVTGPLTGDIDCPMRGDFFANKEESARLYHLWKGCFVQTDSGVRDPEPIPWTATRQDVPADPQRAARELADAGRRRAALTEAERQHAEIEERRSAVVSLVAESARTLAEAITGDPGAWNLPLRSAGRLHCVDLGLTFIVDSAKIKEIFGSEVADVEPPQAKDVTIRRNTSGGLWTDEAGSIHLFNPPARMFRKSNPRLVDARGTPGVGGVSLFWDLEPAWSRSKSVYGDPEFHLLHYRVIRTIKGASDGWMASFETKPAAPTADLGRMFRPPVLFLDDFSTPKGFDPDLRDFILGKTKDFPDTITVHYEIFPVDCAGTVGDVQLLDVTIEPKRVLPELRDALSRFDFEKRPLAKPGEISDAKIALEFRLPNEDSTKPGTPSLKEYLEAKKPTYDLRIAVDRPSPSGQYGADALSSAMSDAGARRIEIIPETHWFTLTKSGGAADLTIRFLRRGPDGIDEEIVLNYKVNSPANNPFRTACGLGDKKSRARTLRFFLRTSKWNSSDATPGPWRKSRVEILMGEQKPGDRVRPVESTLEDYELPLNVQFEPIVRTNRRELEVGRLHMLVPQRDSTAESFKLVTVVDPKRRTGIRLRWQASPVGLVLSPPPNPALPLDADPWRWVAGFHVLEIKGDAAERIASVNLIPDSAAGREPGEFGDVSLIESAYPSEDARRDGPGGWFSAAESEPLFPQTLKRRSIMTSIDEGLLNSLFSEGPPYQLRFEAPGGLLTPEGLNPPGVAGTWPPEPRRLNITEVRSALQAARAPANASLEDGVTIEIVALGSSRTELTRQAWKFDAAPHIHPALADTLDLVQYDDYDRNTAGAVYRRYEVVREASPARMSAKLEALLDDTPVKRDPHGWTVLRSLGLAAAFRLYDTEEGVFLTGVRLVDHVRGKFRQAIERYAGADLGSPFLDLVTLPWETSRAYSFDNGVESGEESGGKVADQLLSTIQIALRPRVSALIQDRGAGVAYYRATNKESNNAKPFTVRINSDATSVAFVDIISLIGKTYSSVPVRIERSSGGAPAQTATFDVPDRVLGGDALLLRVAFDTLVNPSQPPPVTFDPSPLGLECGLISFDSPGILGRFPVLDQETMATRLGTEALKESADRVFAWAKRNGFDVPTEGKPLKDLLLRMPEWWQRFLDHCDPNGTKGAKPDIRFSLGTLATPGVYRVPTDTDGSVGVFLLEESQYGATREFAIQPYGRYRGFVEALGQEVDPITANLITEEQRIQVTIPRTAPVAKPAILSAQRVDLPKSMSTANLASTLELVVARTPDEIISSANRTTESGLESAGISIGFWREFAYRAWAESILGGGVGLNPTFGSEDFPEKLPLTLIDTLGDDQLPSLQKRVPDAWLGARAYRFASLPYFYRIHALAYANAGVVVSPPSVATFVDGVLRLRAKSPKPPTYKVVIGDDGQVVIRFAVPLTAFYDCMTEPGLWTPTLDSPDYDRLVGLPDPGIAYRIALLATSDAAAGVPGEQLSLEPQLDVVALPLGIPPAPGTPSKPGQYVVQAIGSRFKNDAPGAPLSRVPVQPDKWPGDDVLRWRVRLETPIRDLQVPPFKPFAFPPDPPHCIPKALVSPDEFRLWRSAAPLVDAGFKYTPSDQADTIQYCQEQIAVYTECGLADHQVVQLLRRIQTSPASAFEENIAGWLCGMPESALAIGDVPVIQMSLNWDSATYNKSPDGTQAQRALVSKVYPINDCRRFAREYNRALREHWLGNRRALLTQPITKQEFEHLGQASTFPPAIDAVMAYSIKARKAGFSEKTFRRLCALLEASTAGLPALVSLTVVEDSLDKENIFPSILILPLTAGNEAHLAAADLFEWSFEDPVSYHATISGLPVSETWKSLEGLPSPEREIYRRMVEEVWFGSRRRPVLLASRGANPPVPSDITLDINGA